MKLILTAIALGALAASGCTQDVSDDRAKHQESAREIKAQTESTVKTLAQYDKIVAGRKAAGRIKKADASRKQDLEDFNAQQ